MRVGRQVGLVSSLVVLVASVGACNSNKDLSSKDEAPSPRNQATAAASSRPEARSGGGGPTVVPSAAPHGGQCAPGDPLCSPDEGKPKRRVMAASTTSLSGRLSGAQIEAVISDSIDAFAGCTKADATVSIRATVAGEGQVVDASSNWSDPDDSGVRDCVVKAFKHLMFPRADDNRSSPVAFNLSLKPLRND